jgi:hypothetical protein
MFGGGFRNPVLAVVAALEEGAGFAVAELSRCLPIKVEFRLLRWELKG